MFYYYGRKKQIAKHYPVPVKDTIVEPFAGSAAYSLNDTNWSKNVILVEKDPSIVGLWNYLVSATAKDILSLPDVKEGDLLSNFNLSVEERLLISLHVRPGATSVRNKVGRFSRWDAGKAYIAENLYKVKHWKILQGDYTEAPMLDATYFIDPPYRTAGKHYKYGSSQIDYTKLAEWVKAIQGQVICCEGAAHGSYLSFVELAAIINNGGMNLSKKSKEYIFTNLIKSKE